jgi:hypothetical protein
MERRDATGCLADSGSGSLTVYFASYSMRNVLAPNDVGVHSFGNLDRIDADYLAVDWQWRLTRWRGPTGALSQARAARWCL